MFTGIITDIGEIASLKPVAQGQLHRLRILCRYDQTTIADGASIACNGVCLTVVDKHDNSFCVDVSPESLSCTVGLDAPGPINLEKALRLADRLGGHLVSGHVDGFGEVLRFDPVGDNRLLEIRAPEALAKYIARKGSITVNGVSLTTNTVEGACFTINLISHTLEATTLGTLQAGARVNLEIDLIARYVERMLNPNLNPDTKEA